MATAPNKSDRWILISILVLASAVFSGALWQQRKVSAVHLDDAYITFRYAENLARGKGFVYNQGQHLLGTTTPLFCLLLTVFRLLGLSPTISADLINLLSAVFSAVLVFLICKENRLRLVGVGAVILFIFFPFFWFNLASGMETMFTIFLALLFIWLDLKNMPVCAGLISGFLLLTRIDTLSVFAAVFLVRFFKNRKLAMIMVSSCIVTLLPWVVFATAYFGSPIPHSLFSKKITHPVRSILILKYDYIYWFLGLSHWLFSLSPNNSSEKIYLPILTFFAFLGAVRSATKEHWALVFVLWIIFYIAGITLGQTYSFYWYPIPMLSGYLILTSLGIKWLFQLALKKKETLARVLNFLVVISLVGLWVRRYDQTAMEMIASHERAYVFIAEKIKETLKPGDLVFVGEVGIIGYTLLGYHIIDGDGLISPEVYEILKQDRQKLIRIDPAYRWQWWGSPEYIRTVIDKYHPRYVVNSLDLHHMKELVADPEFQKKYQPITVLKLGPSVFIACQRRDEQGPDAETYKDINK